MGSQSSSVSVQRYRHLQTVFVPLFWVLGASDLSCLEQYFTGLLVEYHVKGCGNYGSMTFKSNDGCVVFGLNLEGRQKPNRLLGNGSTLRQWLSGYIFCSCDSLNSNTLKRAEPKKMPILPHWLCWQKIVVSAVIRAERPSIVLADQQSAQIKIRAPIQYKDDILPV